MEECPWMFMGGVRGPSVEPSEDGPQIVIEMSSGPHAVRGPPASGETMAWIYFQNFWIQLSIYSTSEVLRPSRVDWI